MELIDKKASLRYIADLQLGSYTEVGKEREYAVLDEVIDCIAKMPAVMRWIPVTERLPDEKVNCIVHYKHAYCDNDDYWAIGIAFYDGDKFDLDWAYKVTHWMPLPEFDLEVEA